MKPSEVAQLLKRVQARWPHATIPTGTGDVWLEDLAGVSAADAVAEVDRIAFAGEPFPPTSGQIVRELRQRSQQLPPGFDEAMRQIGRHVSRLPYSPEGQYGPAETLAAVAILERRGVHEAVLRFVQQHGLRAALFCPDPSMHALDPGREADRRDLLRSYRDRTVPDWERDPTPGLACHRAELELEAGGRERVLPRRVRSLEHITRGDSNA